MTSRKIPSAKKRPHENLTGFYNALIFSIKKKVKKNGIFGRKTGEQRGWLPVWGSDYLQKQTKSLKSSFNFHVYLF